MGGKSDGQRVAGADYFLGVDGDGGVSLDLKYDVGATNQGVRNSTGFTQNPWTTEVYNTNKASIYATYTPTTTETSGKADIGTGKLQVGNGTLNITN